MIIFGFWIGCLIQIMFWQYMKNTFDSKDLFITNDHLQMSQYLDRQFILLIISTIAFISIWNFNKLIGICIILIISYVLVSTILFKVKNTSIISNRINILLVYCVFNLVICIIMLFIKNQTEEFMVLEKNNQDLNVELVDKTKKIIEYDNSFAKIRIKLQQKEEENQNKIATLKKNEKLMTDLLQHANDELKKGLLDKEQLEKQKALNENLSTQLTNTMTELQDKKKYLELVDLYFETFNDEEKNKALKFFETKTKSEEVS